MTNQPRQPMLNHGEPPDLDTFEVGRGVMWVSVMAGGVACGAILITNIVNGEALVKALLYAVTALIYLVLMLLPSATTAGARWVRRRLGAYLSIMALLALTLQVLASESFLQPIVFTVPIVHAALAYPLRRVAIICALYLVLMNVGIWVSGEHSLIALVYPTVGYSTLMILIVAFTRLSVEQAMARRRTDRLAADLARQRDYLERLAAITATLTRDLALRAVLEQVAEAGRALAGAGQALVWLREEPAGDEDAAPLELAAAVPPAPTHPPGEFHMPLEPQIQAGGNALILPLISKGAGIGALELRDPPAAPFSGEELRQLQPFAAAAAIAIENARLYEQAHLSATLAERNRLARELHDTIAQGLTAVTMQLEAAQRSFERDQARTRARLTRAHELARTTLDDVRRSVWTLAAPLIDGHTLDQALDNLAAGFATRTSIPARFAHAGPPPPTLDPTAATQVLRIVQEALQNIEKYAQASEVVIGSETSAVGVRIWVCDNGVGFDPAAPPRGNGAGSGFGLLSLRERARLAGGTLQVQSAPGAGTRVTLTIPNQSEKLFEKGEFEGVSPQDPSSPRPARDTKDSSNSP